MKQNNFYIGFGTFEKFLAASADGASVYLSKSCTSRPGDYGISFVVWHVTAAAVSDNLCHYWQMRCGSYQTVGGNIMNGADDYDEQCERRTESATKMLFEVAERRGLKVVEGLISFPSDLQILEGGSALLSYDKETNQFKIKESEAKTVDYKWQPTLETWQTSINGRKVYIFYHHGFNIVVDEVTVETGIESLEAAKARAVEIVEKQETEKAAAGGKSIARRRRVFKR